MDVGGLPGLKMFSWKVFVWGVVWRERCESRRRGWCWVCVLVGAATEEEIAASTGSRLRRKRGAGLV